MMPPSDMLGEVECRVDITAKDNRHGRTFVAKYHVNGSSVWACKSTARAMFALDYEGQEISYLGARVVALDHGEGCYENDLSV